MTSEPNTIHIFDTLSGSKRPLNTLKEGEIGIYVCGLTVYDYSHVGHARTFIVFDVVRRYFEHRRYRVRFVCNHTDVDDKIIARARELGEDPSALAERFIKELDQDLQRLNCLRPDVEPRVTQEIPVIIDMIERLVERGHAYQVDSDVFYDVASFEEYGKLSKKVLDDLRAGERVAVDERKKHPYDFALWKAAKPGEPKWSSPWGEGRPGWHIECSAMSTHYLGDTFDIHGGGRDLVFPHHENEIAQAEGATGKPFARYWMHTGPLTIGGEKMSKSVGNFWTVRDVLDLHHTDVLRLFMLTAHYRKPIGYTEEGLEEARSRIIYFGKTLDRLNRLIEMAKDVEPGGSRQPNKLVDRYWDEVHLAMDDDLNTPRFLALLTELAKAANELMPAKAKKVKDQRLLRTLMRVRDDMTESASILGLFENGPAGTLSQMRELRLRQKGLDLQEIETLIRQRAEARDHKDWEKADRIRGRLEPLGVTLMDSAGGTEWELD